ncbi:MAG: 5'-3' exonuclease H3TH domain-containing protein, partial [Phycisphaerales bacterium JB064]
MASTTKTPFKTLYLIDGYAQFFRAYHAIRTPMTSPVTKEPTNLTFGFVGMLLKLLRGQAGGARLVGERPDYVAVAIDVSGDLETIRSEIDANYKANRPPPPEDLPEQVRRCISILEAIGVPVIGAERYEADDVIATLAKQLAGDVNIRVVSKDKDLKQLLHSSGGGGANDSKRGSFELYDIHNDDLITAESLTDEFGVSPAQWRDVLALAGDTVDNIPGVEGVGVKTAAKLIAEWETLDKLLENADKIKGKRGEKIREADGVLERSKKLVSLIDDVAVDFELERAAFDHLHPEALMPILKELGFNRYQDELRQLLGEDPEATAEIEPKPPTAKTAERGMAQGGLFGPKPDETDGAPHAQAGVDGEYTIVRTAAELKKLCTALKKAKLIALDTETTSLRPMLA